MSELIPAGTESEQSDDDARTAPGTEPDVEPAPKFDKQSWLGDGKSDLVEGELPIPDLGDSVVIRSLSAAHQSQIRDQCMRVKGDEAKIDSARMSILTFKRGVIEPAFEEDEVAKIARHYGKAFDLVVQQINEISTATEEDLAKAKARFRPRR